MATVRTQTAGDGVTIIGQSVQVKGNLSGDEDLHVLGRVDGRVELQRTLVVAESGIVKAEVSVKNAIISGVMVGNVHATESVEITKEGRMVGDIFAPRIIIVDGASFRGNVDMGDIANMPKRAPSSERPRPTPVSRPISSPAKTVPTPQPARPTIVAKGDSKADAKDDSKTGKIEKKDVAPPPQPAKAAAPPSEPPQAKGLPQKQQKTRVIVKRR